MTAAAAKKKNNAQPALATTGRGAAFAITLGITLLTLGLAWLISLITQTDSYVLSQLRLSLQGLCGPLCPFFPILLAWGGIKLLVSARHRVSVRDFSMVSAIYLLILAGYTLIALVPQSGTAISYMEFVSKQNYKSMVAGYDSYSAYLYQAYVQSTHGAGGLLGMLLAYPLWRMLGTVGSILLIIVAMIALIFLLLRINPAEFFRNISDHGERRRLHREEKHRIKEQERAAQQSQQESVSNQPIIQEYPMEPIQPAQNVTVEESMYTPAYYQAAPIYENTSVPQKRRPQQDFYAVQPELYDERFPLHSNAQNDGAQDALVFQEEYLYPDPVKEEPAAPEKKPQKKYSLPRHAPQEEGYTEPAKAPVPMQAAPVLQEDAPPAYEDTPPWEGPEEESESEEPKAPAPNPEPTRKSAAPIISEKKPEPAPVPAPKPPISDWVSQVRKKEAELNAGFPEHTTQKGEPKPVYTDPVMPITGERIAISPRAELKEESATTRMDGTGAPKMKQTEMSLPLQYQAPPIRLLNESRHVSQADAAQEDERRAQVIESTLSSFGVEAEVKQIMHGPSITRFAIQIAPGVKVSRVANTAENLALELKTKHVRVEAPIQGTNYIGIEVPNALVSTVALREVLDSPEMRNNPSPLLVALGKDIAGTPVLCDLSKMPHLLIAGATGSGKSVCINSIVCSLLYRTSPDQVRLIMIDPKQVELSVYNSIPHLLVPVVSDPRKASGALAWVVQEMLERYGKFSAQNVRNLAGYNKANQGTDKVLPNIVVIIDEMADLMEVCRKDVEESIRRLAALARAAGIYMVLATQRPSVDVITGVIKNNIPSRIAFAVSSGTDSRTIIDINGAEKLMGKGDMLYKPAGTSPLRVQGCLVTDDEVNAITEYIGRRYQTDYDPNIIEHLDSAGKEQNEADIETTSPDEGSGDLDDLLRQAIEMAVEDGQSSTSMLQRRLRVGYARAGRLIDEMEKRGVVSQSEGSKPRKTLITREQYYEMFNDE
ncbi:MAG: DUF87 domain-containing protein [Clostridiales bacterium]|nr:DUF87 domain-containing protein [Clostridiales bacterium]